MTKRCATVILSNTAVSMAKQTRALDLKFFISLRSQRQIMRES